MTWFKTLRGPRSAAAISWIAVVAWAAFIFAASAHTGSDFRDQTDWLGQLKAQLDAWLAAAAIPGLTESSSLGHFTEYTVLGALLANALRHHLPLGRACLAAIVLASCYGVTDELHQLFVPDRCCDPADWVVDTLGAALGAGLAGGAFARKTDGRGQGN
ncbi:MAG: VanZ family protein [Coriobacteriia bacterium]|nr:VanZ family protein [Coriobacteriia bacterium]